MERVIPHVATRQWVLTVPWPRRYLLARRPDLARGALKVALGILERFYKEQANAPEGRGGFVTALQRFGSALNLNLHFHVVALDGVYVRDKHGGLSFRTVTPHTSDVETLVVEIGDACEAWLASQGFGPDDEVDPAPADDALAVIQQASVQGQLAVGSRAKRGVRRVQVLGGKEVAMPPRCAHNHRLSTCKYGTPPRCPKPRSCLLRTKPILYAACSDGGPGKAGSRHFVCALGIQTDGSLKLEGTPTPLEDR